MNLLDHLFIISLVASLANATIIPRHQVIDSTVDKGSYFVLANNLFPSSSFPQIVTGSLLGAIRLYNREDNDREEYSSIEIATLKGAVHALAIDVDNDGLTDLVVAHGFDIGEEGRVGCPTNCSATEGINYRDF
jgi:hypothetical protein